MGDLSDFEREQIIGVSLAGASVIKTTTLLGASRTAFSEVMSEYTKREKRAKRNIGR
jgi:hypothetical protein